MPMETLADALQRLTAAGFVDEFWAEAEGLRSRATGIVRSPGAFLVDEIVRFEGDSDPSDESAVFALTPLGDGAKGTYTVAFGTLMDELDANVVRRLGATDR
jgi:hypothetical protein